ncbi:MULTISPECIES: hypothetical protein [unclassified Nostoc]|nr:MULTISPECIES: hypothetical protein [unclassified Nostoc]
MPYLLLETLISLHCGNLNYGKRGNGLKLRPAMVFTVEPMLNEGTY